MEEKYLYTGTVIINLTEIFWKFYFIMGYIKFEKWNKNEINDETKMEDRRMIRDWIYPKKIFLIGLREQRRLVLPVSTVFVTVLLWEDKSRSWKSNNTLDTTVLSVVRRPSREVLPVSGLVLLVRRPSLVVLTLSPPLLPPLSDLPSEDWETWLKLKRAIYWE